MYFDKQFVHTGNLFKSQESSGALNVSRPKQSMRVPTNTFVERALDVLLTVSLYRLKIKNESNRYRVFIVKYRTVCKNCT
jgi:hypothetical protein